MCTIYILVTFILSTVYTAVVTLWGHASPQISEIARDALKVYDKRMTR